MEGRIGQKLHSAKEFFAKFKRTPFERLQHGQMSLKELEQRTHGGTDIIRRLEAARLATENLPKEERLQAGLEAMRQSDIQNEQNKHKSDNPPLTPA
jgi:hypothetical protein